MKDLKEKVIRGGFAKLCSQGANFALRIGSLMVLARLLDPKDFGLVGMVTAFTGVLNLFRDFGLSAATVQRVDVTEEQISTLFWINVLVGVILAVVLMALAPVVVVFYHEPRLRWVTICLATAFIFNGAGVQHSSLLERQMRYTSLAVIEIICLTVSTCVGIAMAAAGFKYWALVAATVSAPLLSTICLWITTGWIPSRPRLGIGLRSLMRFGGAVTSISVLMYTAYNFEKVLLGRYWGADAVGIYGRAYQLSNIPTDNLNSTLGGVAFSALSRVQNDPVRFRNYFLKGYSLILALTIPITIAVALFAPDLISVLLGPKWKDAAEIFRLLAPTILVFALINPVGWLIFSLGMVGRSLKASLIFAPVVIGAYLLGLPHGPKGVAFAYSAVMMLWAIPLTAWGVYGTPVSFRDIAVEASRPLLSGIVAAALAFTVQSLVGQSLTPLLRLILGGSVVLGAHIGILLYLMGQKTLYLDLFRALRRGPALAENVLVS
jgi:PST family polysaccharide transporter